MGKLSNILIIDDDPTTVYLQKRLIENFEVSHQVEVAHSGEEALQLIWHYVQTQIEDNIPQLIFMDLNMPFMDGFEFLDAYKDLSFKNKDSVVVVVLTTSFLHTDKKRVKEYQEVSEYIEKPITREKMMRLMEEHFDWRPEHK